MGNVIWNDGYSVNIARMDEQHKKLFTLFNELAAFNGQTTDKNSAVEVMNGVLNYVNTHFSSEEALMKENEYPDFFAHRQAHIDFTMKAVEHRYRYINEANATTDQMCKFLIEWLAKHIAGVDKRYGAYLNKKGIN